MIIDDTFGFEKIPRIYKDICPSLRSSRFGLKVVEEKSLEKMTTRGSDIASTIRATIFKQGARNLIENYKNGRGYEGVLEVSETTFRIRKLTPTESYKLMGFDAEDCKAVSAGGISNAQLYKQAGNSIVVNVLEAIFTSLGEIYDEFRPNV